MPVNMQMRYILSDVEGTTTSIDFVYNTLFPFFLEHIDNFAKDHAGNSDLENNLALVQKTVLEEEGKQIDTGESIRKLVEWTKADRKHPALKNVQGLIWKLGYESGELKSHVYEDVPAAFSRWISEGLKIGIYSSGSVAAQQLLFRFSEMGDLTGFLSDYFDTAVGNKREQGSYEQIKMQLGVPAAVILFLSDVEAELNAASSAGFQTIQVLRPGISAGTKHKQVNDFSQITFPS